MNSQKVVIPAQAGIQPQPNQLKTLDSRHSTQLMALS
jgi:hypothetical protein